MARQTRTYDELKLRVESEDGSYTVRASAVAENSEALFTLPFDDIQLENFVLRIVNQRRSGRRGIYGSAEVEQARQFGSDLFGALITGPVRDLYVRSRERAEADDKGLRISLTLDSDLQHIPWEYLFDSPTFLSHSISTPVVRSLDLGSVRRRQKLQLPLRIIGVDSRPRGSVPLDADRERENLQQALDPLEADGAVVLHWIERATMRELQRELDKAGDYHIFHFIGHGGYDERAGVGVLEFEDQEGGPKLVTGGDLGSLLFDQRGMRLAVLNACEGARTSSRDPFSGVAAALVQCGLPAVVAMQFEITDDAAITFAQQFYSSLAAGDPVDASVASARRAIWAELNNAEFGTPVLFLRADEAHLFDVKSTQVRFRPKRDRETADDLSPTPPPVPNENGGDPRPGDETQPQPAALPKKKWSAKVIVRDARVAEFELDLDNETHVLRFQWGMFKDVLELDGETIRVMYLNPAGGHAFTVSDGNKTRSARLTVTNAGFHIGKLSLRVSGRLLYEG